jgi:hypothetical protein
MIGYEVFKSFYNYEDAIDLQQFLQQRGIEAVVVHNKPVADKVFVGDGMEKDILLKIKSGDFEHANALYAYKRISRAGRCKQAVEVLGFCFRLSLPHHRAYSWS